MAGGIVRGPPRPRLRERVETELARTLARLPDPVARSLAGPPVHREGRTLDARVQLLLRARSMVSKRGSSQMSVTEARRELDLSANQLAERPRAPVAVEDAEVAGRPARVYRPTTGDDDGPTPPGLVWFHGGGFVVGSLDSHDGPCRAMARALGATVVSVDYRLAPEHPFPAAADDATAALREILGSGAALGVDPARVAVGGDSAGGNLALVASQDTREDARRPRATFAVYPAVDFTMSLPSHTTLGRGFFLESEDIRFYRRTYLNGVDPTHPRASPWFLPDLAGLPPTVMVTAGFDPLRDEGDGFADMLRAAGVAVDHRSFPSLFHGFWNTPLLPAARAAIDESLTLLRARLH